MSNKIVIIVTIIHRTEAVARARELNLLQVRPSPPLLLSPRAATPPAPPEILPSATDSGRCARYPALMDERRARWDERGEDRMEHYRIRLHGHLDPGWATAFAGLQLTHCRDGTTLLRGPVADQAALHGLLQHLGGLGLPLLEVRRLDRRAKRPRAHTPRVPGPCDSRT